MTDDVQLAGASRYLTVDELAAAAGVSREIMLRRIAGVFAKRPWYWRLWFWWRTAR